VSVRFSVVVAGFLVCAVAYAQDRAAVATTPSGNPFAERTDVQLTELAAQWEGLDIDQRRALLTEVKHRMAASEAPERIISIKTRRRYGRTYRRADGSLVRIETTEEVLRYHRPVIAIDENQAFGMGFERRAAGADDGSEAGSPESQESATPPEATSAPIVTVSSESN
jgi:hypothetical protein